MSDTLYTIHESTLTDIADAIRSKKGTSSPIAVTDLADEIESISGGDVNVQSSKTVNQNGTVLPDSGYDALGQVVVNVPQPSIQTSKTVTENGTVLPDSGYDALAQVIVNVSGGGGAFASGSVTITGGTTDPVTVEHGLGVAPNCIFVFSDARIAGNVEYFKGGWKFDNLCGYANANNVTIVTAYNNEFRGGALNTACIINVDEDFFDITPQTYPFLPDGCTIYWFALYVDTTS